MGGSLSLSRSSFGVLRISIKKLRQSAFLSAGSLVKAPAELQGMNREQEAI
jgi:hypothetical protein